MEKTTLYFPPELRRGLESLAKRTGTSKAAIVREAVAQYLQQHGRPELCSLGVARSDEITGRTARDWMDTHFSG